MKGLESVIGLFVIKFCRANKVLFSLLMEQPSYRQHKGFCDTMSVNQWPSLSNWKKFVAAGGVAAVCVAGYGLVKLGRFVWRVQREDEPPVIRGHLVWGSAPEFSRDAVGTLQKACQKYGPVFTLRLFNHWVTFIADANYIPGAASSRASQLRRRCGTQRERQRSTSSGLTNADMIIENALKTAAGDLLVKNMKAFTQFLDDAIAAQSITGEGKQVHLNEFLDNTLFVAMFESVFGRWPQATGFTPLRFKRNLNLLRPYHKYLWLGLPRWLFPKAYRAIRQLQQQPSAGEMLANADKYQVSDYVRMSIEALLNDGQSESDIISHNIADLHMNETTTLLAFWTIYQLATHPNALADVQKEVDAFVDSCLIPDTNIARIPMRELTKALFAEKLKRLGTNIGQSFDQLYVLINNHSYCTVQFICLILVWCRQLHVWRHPGFAAACL